TTAVDHGAAELADRQQELVERSPAARTIRVLIVDDQALVRAGFTMILEAEQDMEVIGEAADGREAVDETRRLAPEVVLMDVRMPEMDEIGRASCRERGGVGVGGGGGKER